MFIEAKNDRRTNLEDWEVAELTSTSYWRYEQDENGEDIIDHTPKNETVRIKLGSAFDVVGERKQVDFAVNTSAKWLEEEIEVKLRNHKNAAVTVLVKENLYRWINWTIKQTSQPYEKEDARTIYFPVPVAKDGEATVRYRVRYTW